MDVAIRHATRTANALLEVIPGDLLLKLSVADVVRGTLNGNTPVLDPQVVALEPNDNGRAVP